MSFVRTAKKKENPYVQIDKTFLSDDRLSWAAKGILAYVLSKPDNWKIRKEDLVKRSEDGRAKVESALLNLMACGYIYWHQEKEENGKFGPWFYDVYERPEYNPNLNFCIESGTGKINQRKTKVKERNESTEKAPKADNQHTAPKADNPKADNPKADNQLYSNNDFNKNDFNKNELKEEEEETLPHLSELTSFFIQNIDTKAGKQYINAKFAYWLNLLPYEVIKRQLEICTDKGAHSWSYVQTALEKLQQANVSTIEQLEQKQADYKNSNVKKPSMGKSKPKHSAYTPEWFEDPENYYGGGSAAAGGDLPEKEEETTKNASSFNEKFASMGLKIKG